MKKLIISLLFLITAFGFTLLAKTAQVRSSNAFIFERPDFQAKKIIKLSQGEKVEELNKSGNWTKIRTAKHEGWILRLYLTGTLFSKKISSANALNSFKKKSKRRLRTRVARAVVGVKGLRKSKMDKLKAEQNDYDALEIMESFATNELEASRFVLEYQE